MFFISGLNYLLLQLIQAGFLYLHTLSFKMKRAVQLVRLVI